MIADKLENAERYYNCHENIRMALSYIAEAVKKPLEDGRYVLKEDEVIVHVMSKDTKARSEARMEIHKRFMDIHYMIDGAERCYVGKLTDKIKIDYDPESDNGFFDCKDDYSILADEGSFYAVWPMEEHCPLCNAADESRPVKKIVCKVKVGGDA